MTIWARQQDRFVTFAHGAWLADHVAGARTQLREEHGHISLLIGSYGHVPDDLIALTG